MAGCLNCYYFRSLLLLYLLGRKLKRHLKAIMIKLEMLFYGI